MIQKEENGSPNSEDTGNPVRTPHQDHPEAFNIEQGSEAGLCLSWCTGVSGS